MPSTCNNFTFTNMVIRVFLLLVLMIPVLIGCATQERENQPPSAVKSQQATSVEIKNLKQDGRYLLDVAEAYNLMAKKQYVTAGEIMNDYLLKAEDYPDAYFIMGKILLARKMYDEAIKHFAIAERHRNSFILSQRVVELYWRQAEAFNRGSFAETLAKSRIGTQKINFDTTSGLSRLEEETHETLIKLVNYSKGRGGSYYSEQVGRAYFVLGRLLYDRQTLTALEYFLAAIQNGFLVKESYLYMAYLFAVEDQAVIDDIYRLGKGEDFKTPQKRNAFLLYYDNYRNTPRGIYSEQYREELIPLAEYELLLFSTAKYFESLQ